MQPVKSTILIDVAADHGESEGQMLEQMGHEVVVCHGPQHKELCPILKKGGHCSLVEEAHGIVFELDLERPMHRAILRRYQEIVKEGIPIRVLVRPGQTERFADLLEGVETWTAEPSAGDVDAFSARVEAYERVHGSE